MNFIHGRPAGVEGGRGPALRGFVPPGWLAGGEGERLQSFHGRDISLSSCHVDGSFFFIFFFSPLPPSFFFFSSTVSFLHSLHTYIGQGRVRGW